MSTTATRKTVSVDPTWWHDVVQRDAMALATAHAGVAGNLPRMAADSVDLSLLGRVVEVFGSLSGVREEMVRGLEAVLEGTSPFLVTEPVDPAPPADPPIEPDVPEELAGFDWAVRAGLDLGEDPLIVERTSEVVGDQRINQALRRAAARLSQLKEDMRARARVIVLLDSGSQYQGFGIGGGSPHSPNYVTGDVFAGHSVAIVGPEPQRTQLRGMDAAAPRLIGAGAVITPGRGIPGGDTVKVGSGRHDDRPRAHAGLDLFGVEIRVAGRSAIFVDTGTDLVLGMNSCHLDVEDAALLDNSPEKWGLQLYRTSVQTVDCSADLAEIAEHICYEHGHADGVPSTHLRFLGLGCGGQAFQFTERESEVRDGGPDPIEFEDCVITGFAKSIGRAGSAITFAGAGRKAFIRRCVVIDDDPNDTPGQDPSIKGTSYGALVAWTPLQPEQSYREENDGLGNELLAVENSIFAVRSGNRPVAGFSDTRDVDIQSSRFMTAGSGIASQGRVRPRVNHTGIPCERFSYDGSVEPPAEMDRRARAIAGRGWEDYIDLPLDITASRQGRVQVEADGRVIAEAPEQPV